LSIDAIGLIWEARWLAESTSERVPMPETVSAATPPISRPLLIIAAAVGVLLAGTVALWAHYGTAVFYEMIVAGIATCF
jgi:hypothetical protein